MKCDYPNCLQQISEPKVKGTSLLSPEVFNQIGQSFRSGTASLTLLDETIATFPAGQKFNSYCPFYETFNRKIDRMISSGLIRHWYDEFYTRKSFKIKPEETGPEVLTMDHLGIGFLVCLIPLVLGIIAFVVELMSLWGKIMVRK